MKVFILYSVHINVGKIIGVYADVGLALDAAERFRLAVGGDWRESTPEFLYDWFGPDERHLQISSHPVLEIKPIIIDTHPKPFVQDATDRIVQVN
jgi:hypothetical protein